MQWIVRSLGGNDPIDGGAHVRKRLTVDGAAAVASEGFGSGPPADHRAGRKGRQGPSDGVAGKIGGAVARASRPGARVVRARPKGPTAWGVDAGSVGAQIPQSGRILGVALVFSLPTIDAGSELGVEAQASRVRCDVSACH